MEKVVSMDWPNEEAMASVTVNLVSPCASDKIDAIVVALGTTERSGGGEGWWEEKWWEEEWWVCVRERERERKRVVRVSERERHNIKYGQYPIVVDQFLFPNLPLESISKTPPVPSMKPISNPVAMHP